MAKSQQQKWKNKSDRLFSLLIRSRGECERCGRKPPSVRLETSHIFSRRYAWTRTDLSNALCLCSTCHRYWHDHPTETREIAVSVIGEDEYERVRDRAQFRAKYDWEAEWQRLKELWDERSDS